MVGRTQCVLPTLALLSSGISISLPRTHSTFSFNKLPQLKHIWSSLLFICFKCLHELQFKNKHLINSPGFCLSRESQAITQSYNVLGVNYFFPPWMLVADNTSHPLYLWQPSSGAVILHSVCPLITQNSWCNLVHSVSLFRKGTVSPSIEFRGTVCGRHET